MRKSVVMIIIILSGALKSTADVMEDLPDSVARDMSDLEAILPDSDTITVGIHGDDYYGERRQRDFNAMRFTLAPRHRFLGDTPGKGAQEWFLQLDGGATDCPTSTALSMTPRVDITLRAGRQIGRYHTLRAGAGAAVGFIWADQQRGYGADTWILTEKGDIDYLFSLSNYILGYMPERAIDVSAMIGFGLQRSELRHSGGSTVTDYARKAAVSKNIHLGGQIKVMAGRRAALAVEPFLLIADNNLDLSPKNSNKRDYDVGYGANMQMIYYLGDRLTPSAEGGLFRRRYKKGQRLFSDDSCRVMWRRPSFVDTQAGVTGTLRHHTRYRDMIGPAAAVSFGYWLSAATALRVGYLHARYYLLKASRERLTTDGISIEALINPLAFRRDYNWQAPAGLNIVGGAELLHSRANSADRLGAGTAVDILGGLQLWGRLTDHLRLTIESNISMGELFEGVPGGRSGIPALSLRGGAQVMIDRRLPATLMGDYRAAEDGLLTVGRTVGQGAAMAGQAAARAAARALQSATETARRAGRLAGRWTASERRPLFVDYSYGYGVYTSTDLGLTQTGGAVASTSIGWWATSWIGARVSAHVAKGSTMADEAVDNDDDHRLMMTTEYAGGAIDLIVNPLGIKKKYSWDSPAGVNIIVGYLNGYYAMGAAGQYVVGFNKYFSGIRAGGQLWMRLGDGLRLHIEPMYRFLNVENIYIDEATHTRISGIRREGYEKLSVGNRHLTAQLGLTVLLNRRSRRAAVSDTLSPRGFYAGIGGGWNTFIRKSRYLGDGSFDGCQLTAGYTIDRLSGIRMMSEWISDNIMERRSNEYVMNDQRLWLLSAVYQMSVTTLLAGYNPARGAEGFLHLGGVLAKNTDTDGSSTGIAAGMTLNVNITRHLAAMVTQSYYALGLWDNAVIINSSMAANKVNVITTTNILLTYRF